MILQLPREVTVLSPVETQLGSVHLYTFPLNVFPGPVTLPKSCQTEAQTFAPGEHRDKFIARRAYRLLILSHVLGCNPRDLEFERVNKKPTLVGGRLEFSASKSGNLGCLAVSKLPVGVDLEENREVPEWLELTRRHFPEQDLQNMTSSDFLKLWTKLEAELKLQRPPKGFVHVHEIPGHTLCLTW